MPKTAFKLRFRCINLITMSGSQRALILGVSKIDGMDGWLQADLAMEGGGIVRSPVSLHEFNSASASEVTLMEVEGEQAPSIIYSSETQRG